MNAQPILTDATLEAMLARRAGSDAPIGLAHEITMVLAELPAAERRPWWPILAPPDRTAPTVRLVWAVAMLALLLVALLATAFVAGRRPNEGIVMVPPPSPTGTVNPGPSEPEFDYATDNLCDWLTAEDMNRIVAAAQKRAGTDWPLPPYEHCLGPESDDATGFHWSWVSPASERLRVDLVPAAWFGHDNSTRPMPTAEDWSGHEMLDESVAYGNPDLQCSWLEIMRVQLRVVGHEDDVLWFQLYRSDPSDTCRGADDAYWARVKSLGFAVADAMLRNMNWVD